MDALQDLVKKGLDEQVLKRIESLMEVYPISFILCYINSILYRQNWKSKALTFYQKCYDMIPNKDSLEDNFK